MINQLTHDQIEFIRTALEKQKEWAIDNRCQDIMFDSFIAGIEEDADELLSIIQPSSTIAIHTR